MFGKNWIIHNRKKINSELQKLERKKNFVFQLAHIQFDKHTLAESSQRVLLNVMVACVVGEAALMLGSEEEDPIIPSNSLLQLGVSLISWGTRTWTVERSRKTSFSRILGSYIISTCIQFTKYCLPMHIG
jgi:hypothetical protein